MKTSILLCALATIATAVPTNLHKARSGQGAVLENLPVSIQREKKSPLDDYHGVGLSPEVGTDIDNSTKSSQTMTPVEGRSLGVKKPIVIVKKKMGYHVYRDSDEELVHADPHEKCRNQVKVKLCDDESGSPKSMGSCFASKRLNENFSEKEKENGIKTKETVENLQRGFHKTEHNPAKLATTEDKELEDDLAVHEHIEAARMALEHVQRNFGNLDTLNSQTTSPKTEDFQSKVSDEERLAQWKDAIENIQKNFEIVRNIEDAFKADSEQTNLPSRHIDDTPKIRESEHTESSIDSQHISIPTSISNVELRSDGELIKPEENSDIDMFTAPTEQKELKIKLHSDSLRSEKITEESLDDHGTKTIDTTKTNENVPTMKSSENTPISEGTLKTESVKSENHQEVNDLVHNQEVKAANDINLENENLKSLESNTHDIKLQTEKDALPEIENMTPLTKDKSVDNELNLAKSANMENFDQTTKHNDHDKSVETSDVAKHHSQGEMKHSVDHESETSKHKGDSDVGKMSLTDERPFDQSLKSKSVNEVNEHHKEEIESTNHNHQFHEHKSHGVPTPIQANTKHTESVPIRETGFNNGQHNLNDRTLMRMIEEQNMENKMQKPNEHPITDMRTTEEQSFHDFLMRWANENQQKVQEVPTTPTKMDDFNNGQHFHDVFPSMRLSQEHNTEHHLSENHDQNHLLTHWAHEKQQIPSQVAKTATEFHDNMNSNQHQTMLNQVTDGHNLHELFLMRLAQEKQQNEHPKTTQDFQNGHLHEMIPQNRFANNVPNAHDMSQHGPRMNEHPHIMKQAMASDMDSSMQPSMHVSMRGNPNMEHNDMHWNHHHHAMARYGSGLPVTSASSGAIGVFPSANSGGCGIPLMLSCSPNVISGTLAKPQPHPSTIIPSAYRSGDDLMYYMKRDAKDADELPTLKIQKSSIPFNHKHELIFDKIQ